MPHQPSQPPPNRSTRAIHDDVETAPLLSLTGGDAAGYVAKKRWREGTSPGLSSVSSLPRNPIAGTRFTSGNSASLFKHAGAGGRALAPLPIALPSICPIFPESYKARLYDRANNREFFRFLDFPSFFPVPSSLEKFGNSDLDQNIFRNVNIVEKSCPR